MFLSEFLSDISLYKMISFYSSFSVTILSFISRLTPLKYFVVIFIKKYFYINLYFFSLSLCIYYFYLSLFYPHTFVRVYFYSDFLNLFYVYSFYAPLLNLLSQCAYAIILYSFNYFILLFIFSV